MAYTLGSLFDGSGGFPLAGSLCNIEPKWAAEIEPYPIAVTRSRFPYMKHLGDISKINGGEVEPVDIITFGSPCQDLSMAGKRAGLKHEANGDEETTRSGLFMEAVRIIKEMRRATNGRYPSFALWENVPGAFSSNKGDDFRVVLEELIKIVEPKASVPAPDKNGWPYADCYMGDGWSLAYRVFDAQYWGVPQRRRRIHLVLDLRGERAGKVLFEREGVRGYFAESGTPWKEAACHVENSTGADDREGDSVVPYTLKIRSGCEGGGKGALIQTDKSATLSTLNDQYLFQPVSVGINGDVAGTLDGSYYKGCGMRQGLEREVVAIPFSMQGFGDYKDCGVASGLKARDYKDATDLVVEEQPIVLDRAFYNQRQNAQYEPQFYDDGTVPTLVARGPAAVCHADTAGVDCRNATEYEEKIGALQATCYHNHNSNNVVRVRYIVRRLTPTECARLQGFADRWGDIDTKEDFTDEEYHFWMDVRNTHAEINGKVVKEYTKAQMLTWYNKLGTDSAEYKMWGNGIALPPALYCLQGMEEALKA